VYFSSSSGGVFWTFYDKHSKYFYGSFILLIQRGYSNQGYKQMWSRQISFEYQRNLAWNTWKRVPFFWIHLQSRSFLSGCVLLSESLFGVILLMELIKVKYTLA